MAGLIPQSFLDDLLDRVDIVDVVDHRVKLKRAGKNYSACCPFHQEKTPSFTVSPEKQFYYCFGCGASGNALGFVMDFERLNFPEAVEVLARTAGLDVPREVISEAQEKREQERKSIYLLLEKANDFYQQQLRHHPSKHMAVTYLKGRGLDGKTAKDYGVGFAPPGWHNLLQALAQTEEDKHLLIEGGMLIHQDQDHKLYDRFRHRIMFPIRDIRGRVIGFGGRVLGDDKPKYLNSPETPVFHKGQELYGLYEARLAYRDLPRLLVVEGYMDVVSLAQFGIRYGVATLGTACGPDHLEKAFKYTQEVVFCFDGDQAGRTAAHRALDAALSNMTDGRTVKFLFLPESEDPDTLVRQIGPEKFERMIELAVPLEDFLFDAVSEGLNIRTMEGRATFSRKAAPLLHRLPKGIFKELMFDSLAKRTGLSRRVLEELIEAPEEIKPQAIATTVSATRDAQPQSTQEKPTTNQPRQQVRLIAPQAPTWQEEPPAHHEAPPPSDAPPADYDEYFYGRPQRNEPHRHQEISTSGGSNRYLMPPAQKALALLLTYPDLVNLASTSIDANADSISPALGRLAKVIKLLQERPHYQLPHIIGYWRAAYGNDETEQLASVAGHDLLTAANALSQTREDRAAKANYDAQAAFADCMDAIARQIQQFKSQHSLSQLKTINTTQLSREEKEALVKAALAAKLQKPSQPQ